MHTCSSTRGNLVYTWCTSTSDAVVYNNYILCSDSDSEILLICSILVYGNREKMRTPQDAGPQIVEAQLRGKLPFSASVLVSYLVV